MEINDIDFNISNIKDFASNLLSSGEISLEQKQVFINFFEQRLPEIRDQTEIDFDIIGGQIVESFYDFNSNGDETLEGFPENLDEFKKEMVQTFKFALSEWCAGKNDKVEITGKIALHLVGVTIAEHYNINPLVACSLLCLKIEMLFKLGKKRLCNESPPTIPPDQIKI